MNKLPMKLKTFLCASLLSLAAFAQPEQPIYRLDLTELNHLDRHQPDKARVVWDTLHLAASLQGIVNRREPRVFVRFMAPTDDFWFDYCTGESGWLKGRQVIPLKDLDGLFELIGIFSAELDGFVSYPEKPHAWSNVASTIAGVENRLALRYDEAPNSVYQRFLKLTRRPQVEKKLDPARLVPKAGSTGSPKNDAYLWAKENYLDTQKCSPKFMAYYIDSYYIDHSGWGGPASNSTLTNHDFYIANKAFFFDLGVWEDEVAEDDPTQPAGSDRKMLLALLKQQYRNAKGNCFVIGGFPPWVWKYTNFPPVLSPELKAKRREPAVTEWAYLKVISSYNGIKDADALGFSGMVNASCYRFFPLREHYAQPTPQPTVESLKAQGLLDEQGHPKDYVYFTWYIGDYDAAAWLNIHAPQWWADPAHGRTQCNWAFDPVIAVRAPHVMHFVRTKAAPTDTFIAGDNGFGYLAPSQLCEPRLDPEIPDGWEAWKALNRKAFQQFDLSITGFVIDPFPVPGSRERLYKEYATFSKGGFAMITSHLGPGKTQLQDGVPYVTLYRGSGGDPTAAATSLVNELNNLRGASYIIVRTVLQSPSWHEETGKKLVELSKGRIRLVDARTFFLLASLQP